MPDVPQPKILKRAHRETRSTVFLDISETTCDIDMELIVYYLRILSALDISDKRGGLRRSKY